MVVPGGTMQVATKPRAAKPNADLLRYARQMYPSAYPKESRWICQDRDMPIDSHRYVRMTVHFRSNQNAWRSWHWCDFCSLDEGPVVSRLGEWL